MKSTLYTIFLTSNEPWGDIWFSKQHYANELSKLGHQVYFLNAPIAWKFSDIFSFSINQIKIKENLIVIDYRNNFPLRLFPKFFLKINDFLNSWKIHKLKRDNEKIIWWQFDPFRFVDIYFFEKFKRFYHVVDPYHTIPSDVLLSKKADKIIIVSEYYKDFYKKLNNNIIYIPHGVSEDELYCDNIELKNKENQYGKDYLLFTGTITDDVDLELVEKILNKFPEKTILIAGYLKTSKINERKFNFIKNKHNNLKFIGKVHAKILKYLINNSSICIVPYKKILEQNTHRTPLKIINYLAQYKPIITTINYELKDLSEIIIFEAKNHEDFLEKVNHHLESNFITLEKKKIIENYLNSIQYSNLIKNIFDSYTLND
jgi:hypothetical protein